MKCIMLSIYRIHDNAQYNTSCMPICTYMSTVCNDLCKGVYMFLVRGHQVKTEKQQRAFTAVLYLLFDTAHTMK